MSESFEKRFIDLYDDGQFIAECNDARALVREARQGTAYTKETIPDSFFVEVLDPGKSDFLNKNTFGILFWKQKEKRENSVFIEFNQNEEPITYIPYEKLKDAKFLNARDNVCIEHFPDDD